MSGKEKFYAIAGNDAEICEKDTAMILKQEGWNVFPANPSSKAAIEVLFPDVQLPVEEVQNDVRLLHDYIYSDPFAIVWCTFVSGGYTNVVSVYACGREHEGDDALFIVYLQEGGSLYVNHETGEVLSSEGEPVVIGEEFKIFDVGSKETLKTIKKIMK